MMFRTIARTVLIGSICFSMGIAGGTNHDTKIQAMIEGSEVEVHMAERETKEPSEVITFSKDFSTFQSGDGVGHLKVEYSSIDTDIILAKSGTEAQEMAKENPGYVYLFFTEGGDGLNATYMNFYAPEDLLMTPKNMEDISKVKKDRYVHCWISVGDEKLQMDLLGAYYADDVSSGKGTLKVCTETDFLPEGIGDVDKMSYVAECFNGAPTKMKYQKMITISSYDEDSKRMYVFVNK